MKKDDTLQKIGKTCSIVLILLSTILLIFNMINHESYVIWIVFLCAGICLLISIVSINK
jgi:hypothetical protein